MEWLCCILAFGLYSWTKIVFPSFNSFYSFVIWHLKCFLFQLNGKQRGVKNNNNSVQFEFFFFAKNGQWMHANVISILLAVNIEQQLLLQMKQKNGIFMLRRVYPYYVMYLVKYFPILPLCHNPSVHINEFSANLNSTFYLFSSVMIHILLCDVMFFTQDSPINLSMKIP